MTLVKITHGKHPSKTHYQAVTWAQMVQEQKEREAKGVKWTPVEFVLLLEPKDGGR